MSILIKIPASQKAMKSKKIKLSQTAVEKMIKDLSLLVVSSDRIGSTDFDDPKQGDVEMQKYFRKINVFKILAGIRGTLSEAYNSQSTKADVLRLEEEAERLPYWNFNRA
jgi:hypothetical protein